MLKNSQQLGKGNFVDQINGCEVNLATTHFVLHGERQSRAALASQKRIFLPAETARVAGRTFGLGNVQTAVSSEQQNARNIPWR